MLLVHELMVIRAEVNKPPKDTHRIEDWLRELVAALNMKILMGPFSVYSEMEGNKGLTATCIIETSHIALHVWDECDPGMLRLDVYSCAPVNPQVVLQSLEEFEPIHVDYKFMDTADRYIRML